MACCKLSNIIHNVLFKRRIILDQLTLFIKLQPILDGGSVQRYCLITKYIGNTCFRKIVISIHSSLKICTVTGDICCNIGIRITCKIYLIFVIADGLADHLVGFLYLKFASLCLRNNGKLRIIEAYISVLRCYLVLFLCTVQCLHLCFQLRLIIRCLFLGCISCFFEKAFHPCVWFLGF